MAWKDIKTGQVTSYYPATGNQNNGVNNIIHVPDDLYGPGIDTGTPDISKAAWALGADPRFGRFVLRCFLALGLVLCLFIACGFIYIGWARLMRADVEAHKGKPTVWSATFIKWSPAMLLHPEQAFEVGGPDAIIKGDADGLKLDAFSNLTMQGNVSNSSLAAYDTLIVGNVSNSTLEAHKIVINGRAVNVKKIILRPYEGIPFSKRPH